jgi:hypothetical protein
MVVYFETGASTVNKIIAISNLICLILVLVGGIILVRREEKG